MRKGGSRILGAATVLLVLLSVTLYTNAVDRNNFKTCDQSSFCRRCRKVEPGNSAFEVVPNTVQTFRDHVTVDLVNRDNQHLFVLKLESVLGNTFHLEIDEKSPLRPRYRVLDALKGPVQTSPIQVTKSADETIVTSDNKKAVLAHKPFRLDLYLDGVLTVSANAKGLMRFEHLRKKPQEASQNNGEDGNAEEGGENAQQPKSIEDADPGAWEENYKSHHDSKRDGPEAIALDFSFPRADILFGIPEHADSFALKSTLGGEPYRLYNLDVFEYELNNGMALYGSVPVLYGHGSSGSSAGVYWQNAAETWVDIYDASAAKDNVLGSIVKLVSGGGSANTEPLAAHFMSESGIVDAFILLGPTPRDTFQQYTSLTGSGPLPQLFAIAYHQCRWNYNDEQDVAQVHQKFDEFDMPVDTFWLDIEYTDGKKYFTWDEHKFPHPLDMIRNLTERGRHLTIIIDPHIKRDSHYFFHNDCTDLGYYVKNKDGNDYEGWCWPGAASYADFFDPTVRKYYADQYRLENFRTTTQDVMLWNDMNEPSVFNGPEITMPKDNIHFGGWEHRHVHNLYGHMHVMATFQGLVARSGGAQRPFILTRAHFSGTQRYAAIWTGDNMAQWEHMAASIPMCLSESVAGFSFCGADVGGFFGNPEAELVERWYQLGAYLPFFRAHAHIDTKRREPWLFPESTRLIIREALRTRYAYLPFWYTLFYEHERSGEPIMRPLLMQYPGDKEAFGLDTQFMVGDALMVRPALERGVKSVDVYLPAKGGEGGKEGDLWYDVAEEYRQLSKTVGWEKVAAGAGKIPVLQRGGTIVPRKERPRRAATLMRNDPITLVVCVDKEEKAKGTVYVDDEKSYEYREGKYVYQEVAYDGQKLVNRKLDPSADYPTKVWLEKVVFVGLKRIPKSATLLVNEKVLEELEVVPGKTFVTVRKPGINISENWSIKLNF